MPATLAPQPGWTLQDWLAWQERSHPKQIDLGLERVRSVAQRLDLLTPRACTLTIGGTNGKGSSATLAATIYREAGFRVGLYTSPHLRRYNERVVIDGEPASDAALCRAFQAIDVARAGISLSYFEFGTLAALWLFREAKVDVQVLEVGLGGRLDAVNIIDADAALITNVGLDHTEWLGADLESIGREKAGILRPGRPAVVADRHPPASIADHAAQLDLELTQLGRDYDYAPSDQHWTWHGLGRRLEALPMPALPGAVQLQNASGVIALVLCLEHVVPVSEDAIRRALQHLKLPGRLQRLDSVLLDVGHNAEAAQVLAEHLRALHCPGRVRLVLGMLADKPVEAYVRALASQLALVYTASLPGPRGLEAAALAERLRHLGIDTVLCRDVTDALARARADREDDDLIVVAGSFLTVAAALETLDE